MSRARGDSAAAARPGRTDSRAVRDAVFACISVLIAGVLCVHWDTAERIERGVVRWERIQLDDLLLTAGFAICASGWFALRRWGDARRALAAHRQSEHEKAAYVQKLEELSAQLLATEQAERTRIAELLHDDVGQTLYACRLQLERAQARTDDPQLQGLLSEALELAGSAMAHTRELSAHISPPILHDLGLAEAVEWLLSSTEQRYGVATRFVATEAWSRVHVRLHEPVFQSVRELLANAVKHARASLVTVSANIGREGGVEVHVRDDGCGLAHAPSEARGFGLFSIERRLSCLGAKLRIESATGRGTDACLLLPASSSADA